MACQTGKPSSSSCNLKDHESKKKKTGTSRQSSLHEFVGKAVPRPQQERSWDTVERGDERVPHIEIDSEAAKTWIYPGFIYNLSEIFYLGISKFKKKKLNFGLWSSAFSRVLLKFKCGFEIKIQVFDDFFFFSFGVVHTLYTKDYYGVNHID